MIQQRVSNVRQNFPGKVSGGPMLKSSVMKMVMAGLSRPATTGRPWGWVAAAYALNFAMIWMINRGVQNCTDVGSLPRICDAGRPASQFLVLPMVTLALSFPAMFTLFAASRLGERLLCLVYFIGLTPIAIYTFKLYLGGDFSLAELGCPTCNVAFLGQVIFNLFWLVGLLPLGLILSRMCLERHGNRS